MAEFPLTLAALRTRTLRLLEDQSYLDSISSSPNATTTSLSVTTVAQWTVGSKWEVGSEVVLVTANSGSNPITVQRGFENTTGAAHTTGDQAKRDPRFLTATVNEAINVVVTNWCSFFFPRLVWDTTTAGAFSPTTWVYTAPADAMSIRRVTWLLPGVSRNIDVPHSDLQTFPTTIASTGLGFEVYEMGLPGRTVNVLYEKRWDAMALDADTVPLGFPEDADDLIPLGAALYLTGWRQMPKYRIDELEFHKEMSQAVPQNSNLNMWRDRHNQWFQRAKEVAARRPINNSPQVVWRGAAH